jgi:transcription-repair coupling factor (superfamily II helicase)
MPPRAIALMNSIRIKWIATGIGIEKLVMKQGKMICYFVSDQQPIITSRNFERFDFVQNGQTFVK